MISKIGCTVYPVIVPTNRNLKSFNFYLLEHEDSLTLIDAGIDTEDCWNTFLRIMNENDFSISDLTRIIITHNHNDHVGLVNRVLERKDIPIYAHPQSVDRLKRDETFFAGRIDFFKQLYEEMGCGEAGKQQVEQLRQAASKNEKNKIRGDILPLTEPQVVGELEAIESPGHSPDHLVLHDSQRKWLFSGDHLIAHISSNAIVEPDREGRRIFTLVQYIDSLKKCMELDVGIVFPGHGQQIDQHKELIAYRLRRIEAKATNILDLIKDGVSTADQLAQTLYKNQYQNQFSLVMSEIIGHLDYLEIHNRVRKKCKNGVWNYFSTRQDDIS